MISLDQIRSDLESFTSAIDQEYYLNGAGLKDKVDFTRIYEKFGHLFQREVIDQVRRSEGTAHGEEKRRLGYLKAFLISDYLESKVKELSDRFLTIESETTVEVEGRNVPFRQSSVLIANEPDRTKRSEIFEARNNVIASLNPVLKERLRVLHETVNELGFKDYAHLYCDIKVIDLEGLESVLRPFLEKTRTFYVQGMNRMVEKKIESRLEDCEKHDISFTFRAQDFDEFFAKEGAVNALTKTLAGMGIDLKRQRNIRLDVEERPTKTPRAFVSPVRVPGDIRLVVMPKGGYDDYATLFHEAGHAEHLATTRADLPVEYRYLGDKSVTEGFAFLFEYLITNQSWLAEHTKMKGLQEFRRFAQLYKLYFLRRYVAKLSYELFLHRNGVEGAPEMYRKTLESALVFRHPESHYLVDVDDGFYTANYLRAWIFEAQIKRVIVQHFGEDWFEKRGAGIQLQKWWSLGQKYRVEEMLRDLGYKGLDISPLVEEITGNLK